MVLLPAVVIQRRFTLGYIDLYISSVFSRTSEGIGGGGLDRRFCSAAYLFMYSAAFVNCSCYNGICSLACLALERLLSCRYVYERKFSVGGISGITPPKTLTSRHLAGQHFEYNRCHGRMCYVCNADSAVLFDFAAQVHKKYRQSRNYRIKYLQEEYL